MSKAPIKFLFCATVCLACLFAFLKSNGLSQAAPTNVPPTNIIFSSAPLLESYGIGTGIAEFRLVDLDNDPGTFALVSGNGDDDNGTFRISGGKNLIVNGPLDFETKPLLTIRVRGTDPGGLYVEKAIRVRVVDENEAPDFSSNPPLQSEAESLYSYTVRVSDPDVGDSVASVKMTLAPSWLSFSTVTPGSIYKLEGTPTAADIGTHEIRIKATDESGTSWTQRFYLKIVDADSIFDLNQFIYLPLVVKN